MALALDDRVWPKEDEEEVQLFVSLVYHVTGVKLKASFAHENEPRVVGLWGRMGWMKRGCPSDGNGDVDLLYYGTRGRFKAWFRRHHIRFLAHWNPYNSGLSAGEALVAPFFRRECSLRHPIPTVSLEELFPRSGWGGS